MNAFLIAFFSSFVCCWLIVRYKHLHLQVSADNDFSGPQKFHKVSVPRIGGIAIAVGLFFSAALNLNGSQSFNSIFLICSIPAFCIGIAEDITKKISVSVRFFFILISAYLMTFHLDLKIHTVNISIFDLVLQLPLVGLLFTLFAITGLTNAYNIIDGFNGLSSMVGVITLIAISYICYQFHDFMVLSLSITLIGAILGFLIWNYPGGMIFLGDSGAYLIGLWVASITILLICRHPEISPWFALAINGYPVFETTFTIYRRKIHQGKSSSMPDGLHFHTLIYRRLLLKKVGQHDLFSANARTAPYLWILSILSILPAIFWYRSTYALMCVMLIFCSIYIWIYSKIVRFKLGSWIRILF